MCEIGRFDVGSINISFYTYTGSARIPIDDILQVTGTYLYLKAGCTIGSGKRVGIYNKRNASVLHVQCNV